MNSNLSAVLAAAVPLKEPKDWIVYLPAGEHEISCMVDGKPKTITAKNTSTAAAALQRDLEKSPLTRAPFIDFDHEGKRAAGWIKAFRWTEGVGVEAKVEWSEEGRAAIAGGSMRYFSPEWRIDLSTGECMGLLPVRPAGGLVNLPAFESMAAVAAKLANNLPADAGQTKPKTKTMSEKITEACIKAGLITEDEAASDNGAELLTQRLAAQKAAESTATASAAAVTAQITAAQAEAAEAKTELERLRKETAVAIVSANANKLPPQNKDVTEFWVTQLSQPGDAGAKAKAALESMPSLIPAASNAVVNNAKPPGVDMAAVEAAASAAYRANPQTPLAEHWQNAIATATEK